MIKSKKNAKTKKISKEIKLKKLRDKALEKRVKDLIFGKDFTNFIIYLKSTRKIIITNLLAGIFRGLGFVIGITVVFALLVWFLTALNGFPVIGEYATHAGKMLTEYAEETKYKENFKNIEKLLDQTNKNLEKILEQKQNIGINNDEEILEVKNLNK